MNQRTINFLLVGVVAALIAACCPGLATAVNESVAVQTSLRPFDGKYYKEKRVPMQSSITAQVTVPAGQEPILPIKQTQVQFDTDMTFNPNNRLTPVCSDSKLNTQSSLGAGVAYITDLCPESVIGTGNALIYLLKNTTSPLDDPQMVIFNAGRTQEGDPAIKIYAFSKNVSTGILMYGSLGSNGLMTVAVPVLAFDSAVGRFQLDIPGEGMETPDPTAPDGSRIITGLDRNYVRVKCSDGVWTSNATFLLGERDASSGQDIGPTSEVQAPTFNDPCHGLAGRPVLKRVRKKFPKVARQGARPIFRFTVKNRGTATARQVRLVAAGATRGSKRVASIAPGATRTLRIRPRVTARKGSRAQAVLKVKSKGTTVRFAARIRVR